MRLLSEAQERPPQAARSKEVVGQATSEMILLLPLLVMLAAGVTATGYFCWQGVKVQQAANFAARVQGQERVGGGPSPEDIDQVNGQDGPGDEDIAASHPSFRIPRYSQQFYFHYPMPARARQQHYRPQRHPPNPSSVYGGFYYAVRKMFGPGVQDKLSVPKPIIRGATDEVRVQRWIEPPPVFSLQIPSLTLEGRAYGGECTNMYGLPCWGHVGNDPTRLFYQQNIKNPSGD